jgi:hypothetical protein
MATVVFSAFIRHYVECPPRVAFGNTVREVLDEYFREFQRARRYILDDQECLRPRLAVFVDGAVATDRVGLSDPVHLLARVYVQQTPADTEYENL